TGVAFQTTTFSVPSNVTTFIMTGLLAGTSYTVTSVATASGKTITVTMAAGGTVADAAGLIKAGV
ncbi:hypothetical protein ABTM75_19285, partial [Acinetobacter baumannii]